MAENQIEQTKQYYAEKYISDKMIGYPRISEIIREHCSGRYVYAHANEGGERMSHYYRKRLPDGKWMCLRVADHDVDIVKTYLSYKRKKINADCNGAIGMLRKQNIIQDADCVSLLDRGDIVSPVVVNVRGFNVPKREVRK